MGYVLADTWDKDTHLPNILMSEFNIPKFFPHKVGEHSIKVLSIKDVNFH